MEETKNVPGALGLVLQADAAAARRDGQESHLGPVYNEALPWLHKFRSRGLPSLSTSMISGSLE